MSRVTWSFWSSRVPIGFSRIRSVKGQSLVTSVSWHANGL